MLDRTFKTKSLCVEAALLTLRDNSGTRQGRQSGLLLCRAGASSVKCHNCPVRCFLAIQLPESVRIVLVRKQRQIEAGASGFYSWTSESQMHLTLYFLGETDKTAVGEVVAACSQIVWNPFSLTLSELVLFPERTSPNIVSIGVGRGADELRSLQRRVSDTVFPIAEFKETRAFFPHVTIGRLKRGMPSNAKALKSTLQRLSVSETEPFDVTEFELVKSTVTEQGPHYETIERFSSR